MLRRAALCLLVAAFLVAASAADETVARPLVGSRGEAIVLTTYAAVAHWHYVCMWHTRVAHPNARIFLAAHDYADSPYHWTPQPTELAYLAALNVTVVHISETETPQIKWFLTNFRHVSGNDLVYERFCTARFMGVQRVMDLYQLELVATFDMDIAAFHNVFTSFTSKEAPDGVWGFGSWINSWTREHIGKWNDYIVDFYSGGPKRVADNLLTYGVSISKKNQAEYFVHLRKLVESWWPPEYEQRISMITGVFVCFPTLRVFCLSELFGCSKTRTDFVVDMELYVEFTRQQNRTLIHCHKYPTPPSCRHGRTRLRNVFSSAVLNVDLARPENPSGCRTSTDVSNEQRNTDFGNVLKMEPNGGTPPANVPFLDGVPVVSIHYNGFCKARDNKKRGAKHQNSPACACGRDTSASRRCATPSKHGEKGTRP